MNAVIDWNRFAPELRDEARSAVRTLGRLLGSTPILSGINDDQAYEKGLALYEQIIAALPDQDDNAPLDGDIGALSWFEDLLGRALADYAENRWPGDNLEGGTPAALIRVLMDENALTQSDLPEVGTQGVVSEILNGKRELNLRQIKSLSVRFGIPQHYFLSK